MFHFSMKVDRIENNIVAELAKYGLVEDLLLQGRIWDNFHKHYPAYNPKDQESDGYVIAQSLAQQRFFCIFDVYPQSLKEAETIVKDLFSYPPLHIYLNETKLETDIIHDL